MGFLDVFPQRHNGDLSHAQAVKSHHLLVTSSRPIPLPSPNILPPMLLWLVVFSEAGMKCNLR